MTDPKHAPPHHDKTSTPWTLTLTDATGDALTLSPRRGMAIDRADCLIIDDPAPRPAPTAVGRGLSAKVMASLKAIRANLLTTPGLVSTWSRPAETERNPGASERAYWKRVRRRMRNRCDREREKVGREDQAWDVRMYGLGIRLRSPTFWGAT